MGNPKSIKKTIIVFVVSTSGLLVFLYSFLLDDYFMTGWDVSVQSRMQSEARVYQDAYLEDPDTPLPRSANFRVYAKWEGVPESVRDRFAGVELVEGVIEYSEWQDDETNYCILPWRRSDGTMLYFVLEISDDFASSNIDRMFRWRMYFLVISGVAIFIGMVGMSFFLFRRIVLPVEGISRWAGALDKDNLDTPVDFTYRELNELALLFRDALRRQMAGIEREHAFLRNASHELRTPVAVLQNNLELLERLGADADSRFKASMGRMNNAVTNMRNLIATLLWVSREQTDQLESSHVEIERLVSSIIDENAYLLKGKGNRVQQDLASVSLDVPETPLRIVLNNIIRNAFQYTFSGVIHIRLTESEFSVVNDTHAENGGRAHEGHGVGLMLISQLVDKLGWDLSIEEQEKLFSVRLSLK
ncbi:sensor histidine kinase [Pseudodesulfovibrio karagichevae]|uniref:histidine kinase n=1 Tax=Pseudodesulfovibrio karagichevae TaxID=3239305 RepID=A0ABV4K3S9_9BACT